ncbi:diguanylate cyclase [Saccharibacillus endophyticus]|uniref:Serine/threonine protein kinase n=1 Tax=Saccharibacillus endophyticus TaxID=2060666 RepID=A0ABQ1ZP11_9BACL|nr:diguanylate cyclase [Saccharibacillus endophyticus]GGH71083.1 serine/threonine protein kinase [Saccharibacillus endophyticus]
MTTIDRFTIIETFSDNGRRAVYRAINEDSGETVILKILRSGSADSQEVIRFKKEHRLLEKLSAEVEGVIRPIRLEERGGMLLLQLEDIGGRSLDRIWAEKRPDPESFLRAMVAFIEILGEVHARGVIHKDVKPANLIWNMTTNRLRLIDFGLSEDSASVDIDSLRQAELPEGSLSYMSPEQTGRINRSIDFRTDYYSFGVTLYELAAGSRPYQEENAPEYLFSLMAKHPAPPHQVMPEHASPALSRLIMKLMSKSPEERYQTAYGIKADLLRCIRGETDFEPGSRDRQERFRLPQRLYGREAELPQAKAFFCSAAGKPPRLLKVSGEAGTGKTTFVNELRTAVTGEKGRWAEGKCDPYNRSLPHAALIQAFRGLMIQMAVEENRDDLQHSEMARNLRRELDGSGMLIARLIPELEAWIGASPELHMLAPAEDTSRFFLSFAAFVRGLLHDGRPLLLFMDDMHRADPTEIQLVERLLLDPKLRGLCVVWGYRSDELGEDHPLSGSADRIRASREVSRIELGPLTQEALESLIAETLHADRDKVRSLGEVLRLRTRGNALFARETLREWHRDGLLAFNAPRGSWEWDVQRIAEMPVSEDVLGLLMERLLGLDRDFRRLLTLGAVLGSGFDASLLERTGEVDRATIDRCLEQALEEELIVRYELPESAASVGSSSHYRFRHDRIQQAAYEMRSPSEIVRLHLRIGRVWLEQLGPDPAAYPKDLLESVAHLNKGLAHMEDEAERECLIRLNIEAAGLAKAAYGYDTAWELARTAAELLGDARWIARPDLTRAALFLYAECGYLCRRIEEADEACAELIVQARNPLESAGLYEMQAAFYFYLGLMKESLDSGKKGLSLLGIRLPDRVRMTAVAAELGKVKLKLARTPIRRLEQGGEMSDPRVKLAMRLLIGMFPPAFISGEQPLFGLIVLKKTALTLKYGIAPESALAFTGYALLLSGLGDVKGAWAFGSLALRLHDRFDDLRSRSATQVLTALFTRIWKEPWPCLPEAFGEAIDSGLRSGNLLYLAHACYYVNLWHPALDMKAQIEESEKHIALIENTGHHEALATAKLARQQWRGLAGLLEDPLSFDGPDFSETACLAQLESADYKSGIAIYYLYKMKQYFTAGQYDEAANYMDRAEAYAGALAGSAFMEEYALYSFLISAYASPLHDAGAHRRRQNRIGREFRRIRNWAAHNPHNFAWHELLLRAERARKSDRSDEAARLYDLACAEAESRGPVRYKALGFELAAAFHFKKGHADYGAYLLGKAVYYYAVWGAEGKIRQLAQRYPQHTTSRAHERVQPGTFTASSDSIDLDVLMLASQAISREIELDHLLQALMEIVIKNAGAQRGYILLRQSPMMVEGRYVADGDRISVVVRETTLYDPLPETLLRSVEESGRTLIVDDAGTEPSLAGDPYIRLHRPRSIVCMPLINQNRTVAVIYLENNLVTGAFTQERMKIINLLSRDMVFSLENASLYEELEQSEAKYRELVDNIQDGIFMIQDGRFVYVNTALAEMLGYRTDEMLGAPYNAFIHPADAERVELYYRSRIEGRETPSEYETSLSHRDGVRIVTAIHKVSGVSYRGKRAVQGTVKDITARKRAEQELQRHKENLEEIVAERTEELKRNNEELNRSLNLIERLSVTDELTGLYNRRHFNTVFAGSIARANQKEDSLACLMLDIDCYKKYNDTYGHYEGDQVLKRLGGALRRCTADGQSFAFRLGGEEFGILMPGASREESKEFAEKVRRAVAALQIEHARNPGFGIVTVSIGAVWAQGTELEEEKLYKMADEALYTSKHEGRNRVTMAEYE